MMLDTDDAAASAEFQLTELEARLELASVTPAFSWCCECFMNPNCPVQNLH